jgi:hypothetical protein
MTSISGFLRSIFLFAFLLALAPGLARAADGQAADDIAHFLAGLPPSANSPLMSLTNDAAWKKHAELFNADWKSLENKQLEKVRAWSAANLKQSQPVLYYMFSGPDYLYANAFFPNAKTIIMAGLELPGPIPQLSEINSRSVAGQVTAVRTALGNLLKHSYFITSQMGSQLSRPKLSGTLPIIYVFLARSEKTIHDVSLVGLDKEGKLHPLDEAGFVPVTKGAKIVFAGSDGEERTLYYFRTDLSNKGVPNSGFLKFCETFGQGDAFVKSASYLLHNPGFSEVREFLLKNTVSLVQDDTGIPLKFLSDDDWQLHPFGTYLAPIREFAHAQQPKLVELFKKRSQGPLNFTVGYHWGKPSNLLLAVKATPKTQ